MRDRRRADVAFLWLGEMLLIPHLWPILDALAKLRPDLVIDLWVSTSVHESLIRSWLTDAHANVRLRRAPGFRRYEAFAPGQNVALPAKMPMLLQLARHLKGVKVALCTEQTSLWLPRLLPLSTRFVFTIHGTGPLNHGRGQRLRYAHRLLVPSETDKAIHAADGIDPGKMIVTGYVKTSVPSMLGRADLFANDRPVLLYAPHWQRYRSCWWAWGRGIVDHLVTQRDFNVILAPHQRLIERDPGLADVLAAAAEPGRVHVDMDSFAMVDGSYTRMADLYLGDTSSQLLEFLAQPRPCVFANPPGMNWRSMDKGSYDACGEVVTDLADLPAALGRAASVHARYRDFQRAFAVETLGDTSAAAPIRAAEALIALIADHPASQLTSGPPRALAAAA